MVRVPWSDAYAWLVRAREPGEVDPDVVVLLDEIWAAKSHRQALAELVLLGWTPCGIGDWAVAVRSPGGLLAARICPFDPAYPAFLELCRQRPGNRYLPRVDLTASLDGGGSLTVMEFLTPSQEAAAAHLIRNWEQDDQDAELSALRTAALAVDAEYRTGMPWWDGIDLNQENIRRSIDGQLKLVDVFCVDGAALYGQILEDAAVVRRLLLGEQRRYLLEIPYLARECSPDELDALRQAWAR
jgi:hypothetical protein